MFRFGYQQSEVGVAPSRAAGTHIAATEVVDLTGIGLQVADKTASLLTVADGAPGDKLEPAGAPSPAFVGAHKAYDKALVIAWMVRPNELKPSAVLFEEERVGDLDSGRSAQ